MNKQTDAYTDRQREIALELHGELILIRTCLAITGAVYDLSRLLFYLTQDSSGAGRAGLQPGCRDRAGDSGYGRYLSIIIIPTTNNRRCRSPHLRLFNRYRSTAGVFVGSE